MKQVPLVQIVAWPQTYKGSFGSYENIPCLLPLCVTEHDEHHIVLRGHPWNVQGYIDVNQGNSGLGTTLWE